MSREKKQNLPALTAAAMMAAVLCVLGPLSVPVGPVPIAMGNFAVSLAAWLLGPRYGALSVAAYLLLGGVGVPVFAGYAAGAAVLLGPTGGYLIGYLAQAMIGGCIGTSNVLAGEMFDVPVLGTHAHSWIMSFKDEYTAFKEYARLYPNACTLLVDTYDTLKSGVPNAIRVFKEMRDEGIHPKSYGIRLDSGDLAYLSKRARKMLDDAGFTDAVIAASNDLDELLINDLKLQGATITSWGVGTNLITSKDCPSFGGVYKLAAIQNEQGEFVPKIKISENVEKITNPGNKTIYRIYDKETGKMRADLICFVGEEFDTSEDLLLFDPNATWKKTRLEGGTYTMKELLVPVFQRGECKYTSPSVKEIAAFCRQEKDTLWDETKRLFNPHKVYVDLSKKLYDTKVELLNSVNI